MFVFKERGTASFFRENGTGCIPWDSLEKVNNCSLFSFITYNLNFWLGPNPGIWNQLSRFRIRFASLFFFFIIGLKGSTYKKHKSQNFVVLQRLQTSAFVFYLNLYLFSVEGLLWHKLFNYIWRPTFVHKNLIPLSTKNQKQLLS